MKLEKYNFFCTNCKHQLDDKGTIHLKTERENGDNGDMYLSTSFGTYSYKHKPEIAFLDNELVNFYCPDCNSDLKSEKFPKFVKMIMRVENNFEFEILFSRKAGMHKTYIVTEDGVESYGEHASDDNLI
ncbi:MAG: hypothetical protein AB8B74_01160 [Crocinitomicaceae bacterium]